jgi:two-component system, NarL family, response regulator LiaR
VIIADDHPLARHGLRQYLESEPDIEVVDEAVDGQDVLDRIAGADPPPDVALVDVRMPAMDGVEATRKIHHRHPEVRVIAVSAFADPEYALSVIRAGARGYVLKARDASHIIQAIRLAVAGSLVIDQEVAPAIVQWLHHSPNGSRSPDGGADALSERELEVLQLLPSGHTNKEIAHKLLLSPETVKDHLERIFRKLGATDRTAAVAEAMRRGLIE